MTNAREKLVEAIIDAMIRTDLPTWGVRTVKEVARTQYLKRAEAALTAIEDAGGWAPPGHWIAPDEATGDMTFHGLVAVAEVPDNEIGMNIANAVYAAMRTASLEETAIAAEEG